jgi:hypothetical protein
MRGDPIRNDPKRNVLTNHMARPATECLAALLLGVGLGLVRLVDATGRLIGASE